MSETKTYPLRLPRSLKDTAEALARQEGTSMNQFIATAVAEKVGALKAAAFYAEKRRGADVAAFDRIMNRDGGEDPAEEDRLPS